MKCHWCERDLISYSDVFNNVVLECPEIHATIVYGNGNPENIVSYLLFWDKDDFGKDRYKMEFVNGTTSLYQLYREEDGQRRQKRIFSTPILIHPNLVTDIKKYKDSNEMDRLIQRLQNLKAFA